MTLGPMQTRRREKPHIGLTGGRWVVLPSMWPQWDVARQVETRRNHIRALDFTHTTERRSRCRVAGRCAGDMAQHTRGEAMAAILTTTCPHCGARTTHGPAMTAHVPKCTMNPKAKVTVKKK